MFNRPLIAIDIGASSVKVLELQGSEKKRLSSMGIEVLPSGTYEDGFVQDSQSLIKIIDGLLSKLKISPRGRRVALSIGGTSVLLKRVDIVPDKTSDLGEQIFYEAQQQFQHDMEDMYFRYQEIPSNWIPNDKKAIVMVGAKREAIEQKIDIIKSMGFRIGVVDCDILSITNMFEFNYPVADALIATVNVGANNTQIILSYNGEFLFSREIFIAGSEYTTRIAEHMEVDLDNAESLKISASLGDGSVSGDLSSAMDEVSQQLATEIESTISFFLEDDQLPQEFRQQAFVFICGGASRSLGLDATVAASLRIPVQIINPFQRVDVKSSQFELDYILSQGPVFGNAVGLALRRFGDSAA